MFAMLRLPWQRRIEHSAVMGVWRPNVWTDLVNLMKFGTQQQLETAMTVV